MLLPRGIAVDGLCPTMGYTLTPWQLPPASASRVASRDTTRDASIGPMPYKPMTVAGRSS